MKTKVSRIRDHSRELLCEILTNNFLALLDPSLKNDSDLWWNGSQETLDATWNDLTRLFPETFEILLRRDGTVSHRLSLKAKKFAHGPNRDYIVSFLALRIADEILVLPDSRTTKGLDEYYLSIRLSAFSTWTRTQIKVFTLFLRRLFNTGLI